MRLPFPYNAPLCRTYWKIQEEKGGRIMNDQNECAGCGAPCEGAQAYVCEDCGRTFCASCVQRGGALCPHCCGRLSRPC